MPAERKHRNWPDPVLGHLPNDVLRGTSASMSAARAVPFDSSSSTLLEKHIEDYCEPECSDMPEGMHHPSCAVYLLELENELLKPSTSA